MPMNSGSSQTTYLIIGAVATIAAGLALWLSLPKNEPASDAAEPKTSSAGITPTKSNVARPAPSSCSTAASTSREDDDKSLHRRIEEIDREGKALFKEKRYQEAAEAFTRALDLIASQSEASGSLARQVVTLTNNRSAMYEKASLPDLALSDCDSVLSHDPSHMKARGRRLRILESLHRYQEAIVEVCALQLKYMSDNRDKIRLGLPPSQPAPVSQSKVRSL